jgi:16S rRNA (cytidine1402-2'-O)-methyltransferase
MSVAPFGGRTVTFDGFLSPKSGRRRRRLEELLSRGESFLLYESPHRVAALLRDLAELGPRRTVVVGREMTKQFEEYLADSPARLLAQLEERGAMKGEFALLVSGQENESGSDCETA